MKNKKAKLLLGDACLRVSDINQEVSWVTKVSIQGKISDNGTAQVFSTYLGQVDECLDEVSSKLKSYNYI